MPNVCATFVTTTIQKLAQLGHTVLGSVQISCQRVGRQISKLLLKHLIILTDADSRMSSFKVLLASDSEKFKRGAFCL